MDTSVSNFAAYWNSRFLGVAMNDWLKYLRKQNERRIKFTLRYPEIQLISPVQIPQIVHNWCQALGQPYGVQHRTLDIYEQFMMAHFTDLYQSTISSKEDKRSKWQTIYANVKHQALLRLVSCFQIASKLEQNHKTVSLHQAAQLLRIAHRPCDHSTILGSEITVLTTLAYQVNFPPAIDYIETILCHLVFTNQCQEDRLFLSVVDALHAVAKLLLDLVYHNRCNFFRRLFSFVCRTIHIRPEAREHVRKLQHDRMLLAAAIISGAGFIVEPRLQSYIMEKVHKAVNIDIEDMGVMAAVVVNLLDRTN